LKRRVADLALLGGTPVFATPRAIGQLASPDARVFFGHAAGIYERRRITNNGPLVQELERRLCVLHAVPHVVAVANASLGLVILMNVVARPRATDVIMPAFTYPGLPHLAQWAGLKPHFCDIDAASHALDPDSVAAALGPDTALILAVHQVNSPCFIREFEALSRDTGVPLVFDSVHGAHCTAFGMPIGGFGLAEVFSLHATKMLNGFEGGYITTRDGGLAEKLRRLRNFGFVDECTVSGIGLNAKLNELHAAGALACLDGLDDLISRNRRRYQAYCTAFSGIDGLDWVRYPEDGERWNYEFFLLEVRDSFPLERDEAVAVLRAENALARAYYSPPLHQSPHHPRGMAAPVLPVTERLARRFIQMPVGESLQPGDEAALADLFRFMAEHGPEIRARLEARQ
jgi:dTDP-4-amino-4,6-dideoxygalactose transaminase